MNKVSFKLLKDVRKTWASLCTLLSPYPVLLLLLLMTMLLGRAVVSTGSLHMELIFSSSVFIRRGNLTMPQVNANSCIYGVSDPQI